MGEKHAAKQANMKVRRQAENATTVDETVKEEKTTTVDKTVEEGKKAVKEKEEKQEKEEKKVTNMDKKVTNMDKKVKEEKNVTKKADNKKGAKGKLDLCNPLKQELDAARQALAGWRHEVRLYMTDFDGTHAEFNGLRARQGKEAIIIANHRPKCPLMLLRARGQTKTFTLAALVVDAEKRSSDDLLEIPDLQELTGMSLQQIKQKLNKLNKDTLTVFRVIVKSFDNSPFVRQPDTTIGRAIGKAALAADDFHRLSEAFAPKLIEYDVPSVVRFWRRQY